MSNDAKRNLAYGALGIVGAFILLSFVAQFVLIWTGRATEDGSFRPVIDLVTVLVGAVGGYLTGQHIERGRRNGD